MLSVFLHEPAHNETPTALFDVWSAGELLVMVDYGWRAAATMLDDPNLRAVTYSLAQTALQDPSVLPTYSIAGFLLRSMLPQK